VQHVRVEVIRVLIVEQLIIIYACRRAALPAADELGSIEVVHSAVELFDNVFVRLVYPVTDAGMALNIAVSCGPVHEHPIERHHLHDGAIEDLLALVHDLEGLVVPTVSRHFLRVPENLGEHGAIEHKLLEHFVKPHVDLALSQPRQEQFLELVRHGKPHIATATAGSILGRHTEPIRTAEDRLICAVSPRIHDVRRCKNDVGLPSLLRCAALEARSVFRRGCRSA